MASFGAVGCFATNALSYVPFLAVILWVLPKNKKPKHFDRKLLGTEPWYSEARAIGKDPLLRGGLLTVLVTSLFCGPLIAFAPVLIKDILHSDASHFGGAISAFGIGGLLGALLLLGLGKKVERRKLSSACAILVAVVVVVAALNRSLFALSAILVIAGAALTMTNTSVNSILQGVARDQIRGQAASLFMLAMRGGLSLGNLITGFSVHFFGISHALVANGLVAIVIHAWMYRSWACTTNVKLSPTKAGFIAVLEFRNET
jgi:predicted MFS family arabinose efflux permease